MKFKLTWILVLSLTIVGCDSLSLDEEPETFLTKNQFFQNERDAEAALLGAYERLQTPGGFGGYYSLRFPQMVIGMAEYSDGRGSFQGGATYQFDETALQRIWSGWEAMYESINRANTLIAEIPDIEMPDQRKAEFIAEARFIRALNYYNLVRYWGGVPLRTEPSSGGDLAAPRASRDAVWNQIVSDLQAAEGDLPESRPASENGRATQWAATALLAEVYLGMEEWGSASDKAKEVMDSGEFSLVEVSEPNDFLDIFGPDVVTYEEEIFDIPFSAQEGLGMGIPSAVHQGGSGYAARAYHGLFLGPRSYEDSFVSTWDTTDLRRDFNLYSGADTVFNTAAEVQHFNKYRSPDAIDRGASPNDFPILRYADVLLIFAEAEAMENGGPTSAAYDAVNRIRRRAYGEDLNSSSSVDLASGMSLQQFRDAVIQERAKEFFAEAKRYWDLKRTGTLIEVVSKTGDPVSEQYMLWPLPREEIDANDSLSTADQNPGW